MSGGRLVRLAGTILLSLSLPLGLAFAAAGRLAQHGGIVDLRADLRNGSRSAFDSFECGDVARQFRLDSTITRDGTPSARFEERPGDVWAPNGTVRCLVADYHSGETVGDDYYYGFSVYIPSGAVDAGNLLWVLHHGEDLYRHPECVVAPYALHVSSGPRGERMLLRVAGGNCVLGRGWSLWHPNIPIRGLDPVPRDTWIDFVIHIRFRESATGVVELWDRLAGRPWPARPAVVLRHIPTVPRCDQCGVHDATLYTEFGLYAGRSSTRVVSIVYIAGYRRGTTLDVIRRGFPK